MLYTFINSSNYNNCDIHDIQNNGECVLDLLRIYIESLDSLSLTLVNINCIFFLLSQIIRGIFSFLIKSKNCVHNNLTFVFLYVILFSYILQSFWYFWQLQNLVVDYGLESSSIPIPSLSLKVFLCANQKLSIIAIISKRKQQFKTCISLTISQIL